MSKYVNEQQFIREQMELYTPVISMETLRRAFIELPPEVEKWLKENDDPEEPCDLGRHLRTGLEKLRQQFLKFIYEKYPYFHIQVVANEYVSMKFDKHAPDFPSNALRCNTRLYLKRDHYETVIIEVTIECFNPFRPHIREYHIQLEIIK